MKILQAAKTCNLSFIALSALLAIGAVACREPAESADDNGSKIAKQVDKAAVGPVPALQPTPVIVQKNLPAQTPAAAIDKPKIISSRDEPFKGAPSCIYTISYQDKTDHEVRWSGNKCAELSTDFMTVSDLENFGKLKELDEATRLELAKNHKQGVFYVEGEFTASIYPQDIVGIPHEISVAD